SKDVYKKLRNTRVGDKTVNPYIQVTRLGGKDRYATNKKINQYTQPGFPSTSERALVATGTGFADAVAMGPIAYSDNAPLILVRGDSLGTSAQNQLEEFSPKLVAIAGGERSVSSSVEESIKDMSAVDIVRRYAGDDRTGTAAAIAEWAAGQGDEVDDLEYNEDTVLLANGAYYADALVAGPLSGSIKHTLLLSKSNSNIGPGLDDFLGDRTVDQVSAFIVFGMSAVTPKSLVESAAAAVGTNP